jgi:hypothetical protein
MAGAVAGSEEQGRGGIVAGAGDVDQLGAVAGARRIPFTPVPAMFAIFAIFAKFAKFAIFDPVLEYSTWLHLQAPQA